METQTYLSDNWSYTQLTPTRFPTGSKLGTDKQEEKAWHKASKFPTSIHVELEKRGEIPDHRKGLNEWDIQWVGESDWRFKTSFELTEEQLKQDHVDLIFEGLDTFCHVQVDDKEILYATNMFQTYRLPLKSLSSGSHSLVLTFPSSWFEAKRIEAEEQERNLPENVDPKTGEKKDLTFWNGVSARLYVRKAQYGWGWDWGPVVMTVGPWKPVFIHAYNAKITEQRVDTILTDSFDKATLKSTISLSDAISGTHVNISLLDKSGKTIKSQDVEVKGKKTVEVEWQFDVGKDVELWWPIGHGKQPLYEVIAEIKHKDGTSIATRKDKIGFRTIKLIQEALIDAPGSSFLFEVNGRRVFCGGSNWIPADNYLTEVTPELYRAWLQLMVDGNQNMVRVWGGGIYEYDYFYDICDELGLLVWQDFMFGCGQYPANDKFLESVQVEAEQAVKQLRNHASLAIFAGNNEDYQLIESIGITVDYSDTTSDFTKTNFPARHIYEKLLPSVVESLCETYYHPSSPFGGQTSGDKTVGDIHQWNVWHGTQEPWANWDILAGRFVSEFGMEGYPDIRTVDHWLDGNVKERFPQSRTNCSHNKADGFERRLELYLMENFRHAFDMESYVYYTQVMQAETLAAAYRLWRRNWKGKGKELTSGALVWQINDCWPTTSWAIVDYFLRPKPAFFAIARELRPFTVGMARKDVKTLDHPSSTAFFKIEQKLEIWGNNSSFEEKKATLEVVSFDLDAGQVVDSRSTEVTLAPNASTEFWSGNVAGQPTRTTDAQVPKIIVVGARLIDQDGTVLARYANWPEPWKYIQFPDAGLKIDTAEDGETLTLSCSRPIKGVILDVEDRSTDATDGEVKWSDQAIDLMPGDHQKVVAKGLKGRKVKARFLGDGSA